MKACTEYRALLDRSEGHSGSEAAGLAAHLTDCADCTAYAADVEKTAALLRRFGRNLEAIDPVEGALERLSSRISAGRRQMSWALVLGALCIAAPFAKALLGGTLSAASASMLGTIAAVGITVWAIFRDRSVLEGLRQRSGNFYGNWRRDLTQRIRMTTFGAVFAGAWGVGLLCFASMRPFSMSERALVLGVAVVLVLGCLRALLIEVRDLRSELRLIGEAADE